jgi:Ni/Co efflux regulator RcnB
MALLLTCWMIRASRRLIWERDDTGYIRIHSLGNLKACKDIDRMGPLQSFVLWRITVSSLQEPSMKNKSIVSSLLAATLAFGALPVVQAQDHGPDQRDQREQRDQRGDQRGGPRDQRDQHGQDNRGGPDRRAPQARDDHREGRGAGPNHGFYRGDRLPPEYRNRQYVVNNWRDHHLNAPPRGYHWVQTGNDYVLVAITTGVILQMILGN